MNKEIAGYIGGFPPESQNKMRKLYAIIRETVPPETAEKLSWRMPTFYLEGNLVHFAGFRRHIGFYPGSEAVTKFAKELKGFKSSIGGIQFPYDKPLPDKLIRKIVKYRVRQTRKGS